MHADMLKIHLVSFLFICCIFCAGNAKYVKPQIPDRMRIQIIRQKTPYQQLINAPNLNKYGVDMEWLHKKPKPNPKPRTNDSIALRRYLDHEFYGQVVIGHPGQILNVAFDTAWDLSWVISSECNSIKAQGCWFHNKYDHTKSSEYKKDGKPYTLISGNDKYVGYYSYDNISIAHSNTTNQSFVEMVQVPNTLMFNKADGVLGLGQQVSSYKPFFIKMLEEKKIKDPVFSIYLNRDRQSKNGGNIMLGYIEKRHIHQNDEIQYLPVAATSWWQFDVDKVYFNDNKNSFVLCKNGCKGAPDTSTNNIIGPADDVKAIHKAIKASEFLFGKYSVECDTVNKLPKIDFLLGGRNFTLSGPDYIIKMSYLSVTVCVSAFMEAEADIPSEQNTWILGGAFLAKYYSIYKVFDKQIGFVTAA